MRLLTAMITVVFLASACAINVDIAHKDGGEADAYRPVGAEKIPLNAVIILRDENETRTKRRSPGGGITEVYKLPSGKIMNAALKSMAPHFFQEYSFHSGEGAVSGGDEGRRARSQRFGDGRSRFTVGDISQAFLSAGADRRIGSERSDGCPRLYRRH